MNNTEDTTREQIADRLRVRIEAGEFGTNGIIPSSSDLATEYGANRITASYALQLLRAEGLLLPSSKNRYRVNRLHIVLPGLTANFEQFLTEQGHQATIENVIEPVIEPMPRDVAALFGQAEGVHVVHRLRKQGVIGQPLRLAENWYPAHLAGQFVEQMRQDDRMDVLAAIRNTHQMVIVRVDERVRARVPHTNEVELLSIARFQPVFEVVRVNLATDGQPVMFNRIIMVASNIELQFSYPVEHWK